MATAESEYNRKRDFRKTSEPPERKSPNTRRKAANREFVVQKHAASRLHYDFRLELEGTLKSWAIPKGPSLDPSEKRLAVHVEDHPLEYRNFEGNIPKGQYGGGDVIVWDRGVWEPEGDPRAGYEAGKLEFTLHGEKLSGSWNLIRISSKRSSGKEQWLLIKSRDESATAHDEYDVVSARPESVLSGDLLPVDRDKPATCKRTGAAAPTTRVGKPASSSVPAARSKKAGARTRKIPDLFAPQLATLVSEPPAGDWLYEIKFDGYRILARIKNGKVRLFSRNGKDWTARLPQQVKDIESLGLVDSWLDGEVVVLNKDGLPDFQDLQNAFNAGRSAQIVYYLFDAPFLNGKDMREEPVEVRRAALEQALEEAPDDTLRFSAVFDDDARSIHASACAMSLEGVIGKRRGSLYVSRRSPDWIKLKCRLRQEFVIVGYTPPKGSRSGFGALLLAVNTEQGAGKLRYAGRVGTGFTNAELRALHEKLRKLERKTSPLAESRGLGGAAEVHWVKPELVCEVEFAEWTKEELLRQGAFISLRSDKAPEDIVRERPAPPQALPTGKREKKHETGSAPRSAAGKKSESVAGVRISSGQRIIDSQSGTSKWELAAFYDRIADRILPQLAGRPVSLLRAPEGIDGDKFFQKHAQHLAIPDIRYLDEALDPGHPSLMQIDSRKALIGAVQMGSIEFHTWGSSTDRIERPDRLILDMDPDPQLPWQRMIEATQLVLSLLDELGLDSRIKTSGGRGTHIIIPLARYAGWDEVKAFARAIAEHMAAHLPDRFTAKMGPENRVGKIFTDYLRNHRGASTVAAYSVRARQGLPVSVPVARDELEQLQSAAQWSVSNLHERLDGLKNDPWEGYSNRQRITAQMWEALNAEKP